MVAKEEIKIAQADEEDILRVFDDDLFFGQIDIELLEMHLPIDQKGNIITKVDEFVGRALHRALNIMISEGDTIYATRRKTD